jgi:hypothetical protein
MKIVKEIALSELKKMSENFFGNMVKAVIDIERKLIAIDAELHSDLEALLLEDGSKQQDLWGINFYPEEREDFVEFDSMINIRPSQNNKSRSVENETIRQQILQITTEQVKS